MPTGLTGTPVAASRIDLAWTAATDNLALAGYNVYRDAVKVNTAMVGSTSYSDTGLVGGANHTYQVRAIDAAGNVGWASNTWSGAANSGALATTYAYDPENRLTQLATGGQTIGVYAYDGAGNRVGKTAGGVTTAYTLDLASGLPQVLTETSGSSVTAYAYAGGPLEIDKAGTTYWYLSDTLGSVRPVTDSTGASPATYAYSAFGSTRKSTGSLTNEVRFTGERTDTESGLEFLRARTYDPSTGTFLQRDSWGITATSSQSIDAYVYTANNPINDVDPSGHCTYGGYGGTCSPLQNVGDTSTCAGHDCSPANGAPVNIHTCAGHDCPGTAKAESTPKKNTGIYPGRVGLAVLGAPLSFGGDTWSHTFGGLINHPADFLHDRGLSFSATIGICGGGNVAFNPVAFTGQVCVIATTDGQVAITASPGAALGGGLNAGLFAGPMFSTAGSAGDQKSWYGNLGGGGEIGGGAQGTVAGGLGRCGQPVMNVSGGPAVGLGGHAEGGGTYTFVLWQSKEDKPC